MCGVTWWADVREHLSDVFTSKYVTASIRTNCRRQTTSITTYITTIGIECVAIYTVGIYVNRTISYLIPPSKCNSFQRRQFNNALFYSLLI